MIEKGMRDDYIILVGGAPLNEEFGTRSEPTPTAAMRRGSRDGKEPGHPAARRRLAPDMARPHNVRIRTPRWFWLVAHWFARSHSLRALPEPDAIMWSISRPASQPAREDHAAPCERLDGEHDRYRADRPGLWRLRDRRHLDAFMSQWNTAHPETRCLASRRPLLCVLHRARNFRRNSTKRNSARCSSPTISAATSTC